MADVVERYNASGTLTGSGSNVSAVQTSTTLGNPAEGDVIKVFGNAPYSPKVDCSDSTYQISKFTVQSGDGTVHTVTASNRWYDIHPDNVTRNYDITISNLKCMGYSAGHCNGAFITLGGGDKNTTLKLTLNNLEVNGFVGNNDSYGGAINANRAITINGDNVVFTNNSSGRGGAINTSNGLTLNIDNVSFIGNKATNGQGGAIYTTGDTSIIGNSLIFKNNTSTAHAGAIRVNNSASTLTLKANTITFESNNGAGNEGGAICAHYLVMNGTSASSVTTFKNNKTKNFGGAICAYTEATFKTGSFYFDNNSFSTRYTTNGYGGGAMTTNKLTISDVNVLSFTKNNSAYNGGAINLTASGVANIEAKTIIFEDNVTNDHGGAIHGGSGAAVSITGESISFARNSNKSGDGGAIRMADSTVNVSGKNADTVITFSGNVSKGLGGAISAKANLSNGKFTFENNSAGTYGGAIHGGIVAFSGDGTSAVFTGNTAVSGGNDLNVSTSLSFTDNGTYSFDGGIRLVNDDTTMTIDKSQVTVSGRANDATNNYQLQNVTIYNGGKLTANLDYIDSLTGTFNIGTADSAGMLELNVSGTDPVLLNGISIVGSNKGEVKKTGEGTLQIFAGDEDMINCHGFVVSSGRLDMKEYFKGTLEIGESIDATAIFSPGNSVGSLDITGTFKLNSGSTLLIEQDGSLIDTLSATTFDIASDSIIDFAADSLQPGAEYPIIVNSSGDFGEVGGVDYSDSSFWNGLLTPSSDYYWNLSVRGDTVYASVDANAVPEPSTWALLLLGAAGLLYVRKQTRK